MFLFLRLWPQDRICSLPLQQHSPPPLQDCNARFDNREDLEKVLDAKKFVTDWNYWGHLLKCFQGQ